MNEMNSEKPNTLSVGLMVKLVLLYIADLGLFGSICWFFATTTKSAIHTIILSTLFLFVKTALAGCLCGGLEMLKNKTEELGPDKAGEAIKEIFKNNKDCVLSYRLWAVNFQIVVIFLMKLFY